jgi:hypothetical protein
MDYMSVDGPHDHEYGSHRKSRLDVGAIWQYCYTAAEQYLGIYTAMRDPWRILVKHKWAPRLTKQLLAEVILKASGEHKMIVRMSMVLVVAVEQLKHESCTFSIEDIAERAYRIASQPGWVEG